MPDPLVWAAAAAGGAAIGALYLAGLWATVRRLPTSRHPVLLAAGSFLIRVVLLGIGVVVLMGGARDPVRLLAALAGFVVVRTVLVWRVRRGALQSSPASAAASAPSSEVQP